MVTIGMGPFLETLMVAELAASFPSEAKIAHSAIAQAWRKMISLAFIFAFNTMRSND